MDCVPIKESSHVEEANVLLMGLDFNRCVEGGLVSNSPLEFRQFSFIHTVQVSERIAAKRFRGSPLYRHAIVP